MAKTRKTLAEPKRASERLQKVKEAEEQLQRDNKISKPKKRFRRPKQRKSCHLLKLPGELRNVIYSQALVASERITIKASGPNKGQAEPALLRVCKSIRHEARSIYYRDNRFYLELEGFNGADFSPWARQYMPYQPDPDKDQNMTMCLGGPPNWDNLVRWVKDYYHGSRFRPDLDDPTTRDDYIVGAAFNLAVTIREKTFGYGWPTAEKALESLRHALKGTCSRWADERTGH